MTEIKYELTQVQMQTLIDVLTEGSWFFPPDTKLDNAAESALWMLRDIQARTDDAAKAVVAGALRQLAGNTIDNLLVSTQERIEKQKQIADKVLTKLHSVFPTAVVMGGAPRDWYRQEPATDIDFYFQTERNEPLDSTLKLLGFNAKLIEKSGNYAGNVGILSVWECEYEQEILQFIQIWCTEEQMQQSFPFGICKISYNKTDGIKPSKNFLNCLEQKLLVKSSELYADEHKYIQKIKQKFPDWCYYESTEEYRKEML